MHKIFEELYSRRCVNFEVVSPPLEEKEEQRGRRQDQKIHSAVIKVPTVFKAPPPDPPRNLSQML